MGSSPFLVLVLLIFWFQAQLIKIVYSEMNFMLFVKILRSFHWDWISKGREIGARQGRFRASSWASSSCQFNCRVKWQPWAVCGFTFGVLFVSFLPLHVLAKRYLCGWETRNRAHWSIWGRKGINTSAGKALFPINRLAWAKTSVSWAFITSGGVRKSRWI